MRDGLSLSAPAGRGDIVQLVTTRFMSVSEMSVRQGYAEGRARSGVMITKASVLRSWMS